MDKTYAKLIDLNNPDINIKSSIIISVDTIGQYILLVTQRDVLQIDTGKEALNPSITRLEKICFAPIRMKAITMIEPDSSLSYVAVGGDPK